MLNNLHGTGSNDDSINANFSTQILLKVYIIFCFVFKIEI